MNWAQAEMAGARVWDGRCRRSLVGLCERLAQHSEVSFSTASGPALRKAAHRIFSREETSPEGLLAGHSEQTARRCRAHDLVLVAQDTMTVSLDGHQATQGLGPIDKRQDGRGLFVHTALAMTPQGLPLGVLHQQIWARDAASHGQQEAERERSWEEKESGKWLRGLQGTEAALDEEQRVLLIQDREADLFDFLAAPRRANTHLLVRARQPRRVVVPLGAATRSLWEEAAAAPCVAQVRVQVPPKPHQSEREAVLEVRLTEVWVKRPNYRRPEAPKGPIRLWVVVATEPQPPEGEAGIEWVLLSTMPVPDAEAACQMIEYYTKRWVVERFHYTLKQGCRIERLQMDTFERLSKAIALCSVVAWRLLWITHLGREQPDAPAAQVLEAQERSVLEQAVKGPVNGVREAVRAIAKLGGFPGNPAAGEPGVKTLWLGLRQLNLLVQGWNLALAFIAPMGQD